MHCKSFIETLIILPAILPPPLIYDRFDNFVNSLVERLFTYFRLLFIVIFSFAKQRLAFSMNIDSFPRASSTFFMTAEPLLI